MPLVTLLDFLTPPPAHERPRQRRRPSNQYLHVREVKGGAFQARVWLGIHEGGSLNLGLFTVEKWEDRKDAEWAAGRASKAFRAFYRPHVAGHGLRETLEHLKSRNLIPANVLPPRVRKVADGYIGFARFSKLKRVVETAVFACPWEAYAGIWDACNQRHGRNGSRLARR